MVKAPFFQRGGHVSNVSLMDREGDFVLGCVLLGQFGVKRLEFQAMQLQALDTPPQTERGGPCPAAQIKNALTSFGGNTRRQQHRINSCAVALLWLPELQAPAQKGVMREIRDAHRRPTRCPAVSLQPRHNLPRRP